jgi:hypothetical protein
MEGISERIVRPLFQSDHSAKFIDGNDNKNFKSRQFEVNFFIAEMNGIASIFRKLAKLFTKFKNLLWF